jgi:hypothetical protein
MESDAVTYFAWFVGLTVVLLVLLAYWAWRSRDRAVTIDEFSGAKEALESVLFWFPAVNQVFDPSDLEFIRQSYPETERLFQRERKTLAISWLRHTREQIARLMGIHLRLSRCIYEPHATIRFDEFRLALDYLSFAVFCHLLLIFFWLRGPLRVRKMVGYTMGATERFCVAFARRHESINPARLVPRPN